MKGTSRGQKNEWVNVNVFLTLVQVLQMIDTAKVWGSIRNVFITYLLFKITGTSIYIGPLVQFLKFFHLSKRISKQIIHQLKAPIKSSLIHIRYWVWHHPGGRNASLTEKALLLQKLVWSLPWQKFSQFQNCFHLPLFIAFFWGI